MPLDDIFHEKPTVSAENIAKFWQRCTLVTGGIPVFTLIGASILGNDYDSLITYIAALIAVPLGFIAFPLSILFSRLIPYRDFSIDERTHIYFWLIASLSFLIYWVFYLDLRFNDLAFFDRFF